MKEKVTALIYGSLKYGKVHYRFIRNMIANIEQVNGVDHIILCLMDDGSIPDLTKYGSRQIPLDIEILYEDSLPFLKKLAIKYSTEIFIKIHHPCGFFFNEIVSSALDMFKGGYFDVVSCHPFDSSPVSVIDIFRPTRTGLIYTDYRSHVESKNIQRFDPEKEFNDDVKKELMHKSIEFPQVIILELSNVCNLRCEKCNFWNVIPKTPFIHEDTLQRLLSEIASWPADKMLYFDLTGPGEPLMFKGFVSLLYKLDEMDNNSVVFNTNGVLLNKENIRAILETNTTVCVSLDAACETTYNLLQNGGNYQRVVDNLELLLSERERTDSKGKIGVSFVVSSENNQERNLYLEKWQNRVDFIRFQSLNKDGVTNKDNIQDLFDSPNLQGIRCYFPERVAPVKANGDVIFCFGKTNSYGNISEKSLYNIWNGENKKLLLKRYYTSMAQKDNYCDNCYSRFCYNFDKPIVGPNKVVQRNAIVNTVANLNK